MPSEKSSDEETFFAAMQDVTPIKQGDKVLSIKGSACEQKRSIRESLMREDRQHPNYLSIEKVEPLDPYDVLDYKRPGIQEGVYKNLRLGKYTIESTLNIQQKRFKDAREMIYDFVLAQHELGSRAVLIRHGIGLNSKPFPAFIKSYVYQWLRQMPEVLAFHSALKPHGGLASAYVLLKKNRKQKQVNRELHRSP